MHYLERQVKRFEKVFFVVLMVCVVSLLIIAGQAVAAHPLRLDWGPQLAPDTCGNRSNRPIVHVMEKVENTVDSGVAGNNWAFDEYIRHIQVWEVGTGQYCVIVQYNGRFDAQAGQMSPGGGEVLDGDEDGTFQGGYRAIVTGTLRSPTLWKIRGAVGTHDYGCDIDGDCPGYVNWLDQYFESGYVFQYNWWGWIYHAGKDGIWVNAINGNEGDIK